MNELPDDLWAAEQYLMRVTQDLYVSDADGEIEDSVFTTESIDRLVVIGASLIFCSSAAMALVGAMAGWSISRMTLRLKAFGLGRVATRG